MRYVLLGAVLVLLTAGVVYGLVVLRYTTEITDADAQIGLISNELIKVWTEPVAVSVPSPATPSPVERGELTSVFCLKCHDRGKLSSFHYPGEIKALEERRGRPILICTTCHGEPVMPVHFKAIQKKVVRCETCHIRGDGSFTVPEKREGDLLICQLCHARGNYITIHIDGDILEDAEIDARWIRKRQGLPCTICHNEEMYGGKNVLDLHEEAVAGAGAVTVTELERPEEVVGPEPEGVVETGKREAEWGSPAAPTTVVRIG